ncbi:MAG: hypothetical protein QM811_07660 [Pirellulales bacterium]
MEASFARAINPIAHGSMSKNQARTMLAQDVRRDWNTAYAIKSNPARWYDARIAIDCSGSLCSNGIVNQTQIVAAAISA